MKIIKNFNKFISILLTVIFIVNCVPAINLFAEETEGDSGVIEDFTDSNQDDSIDEPDDEPNIPSSNNDIDNNNTDIKFSYQTLNDWGSGFTGRITVRNDSGQVLSNWSLEFDFDYNIDSVWGAGITSRDGNRYFFSNLGYNADIQPNGSVEIGFNGYPGLVGSEPGGIILTYDGGSLFFNWDGGNNGGGADTPADPINPPNLYINNNPTGTAFDYALFADNALSGLTFYAAYTYITGDVHSNGNFYFQGTELQIGGKCEAAGTVTANTPSFPVSKIYERLEYFPLREADNLCGLVYEHIMETADVYDTRVYFNQDQINIENSIIANGGAQFNGTAFTGQGTVYAKENIEYNANSITTLEGGGIFLVSENGDITVNGNEVILNGVLYAPNGAVRINVNDFTLNGRIVADFIEFNGTTLRINAGENDLDFIGYLFAPDILLEIDGEYKVNRKIALDLTNSPELDRLTPDEVIWVITDENGEEAETAVDNINSGAFTRYLLFKKPGLYKIEVKTGYEALKIQEFINIAPDIAPVADFEIDDIYYLRAPENGNKASVTVTDCSYSPDGDVIGKKTWYIYYDRDNDGIFSEDEKTEIRTSDIFYEAAEILNEEKDDPDETLNEDEPDDISEDPAEPPNETTFTFETPDVGKYMLYLEIQEYYENTIPYLLTDEDYLKGNSAEKPFAEKTFEVNNVKPEAKAEISKAKLLDLVFTLGGADGAKVSEYAGLTAELEGKFKAADIFANISNISTASLSAKDTFAWDEYDHYNYADRYLPTLPKHIIYEEDDIKMVGYSVAALKDFLYIEDGEANQKTFTFDLQRDKADWHSMEGGGFLFNTSIQNGIINGYCILVTQQGLKLVRINNADVTRFTNGSYANAQNAGSLLRTFPINGDVYANHSFKITVDAVSISVWDNELLIIDEYPLTDLGSYGYGPIISHISHSCSQQSYFTFKNIRMETITGRSLKDALLEHSWQYGSEKVVVNISDGLVSDLTTREQMLEVSEIMAASEMSFIGLGNETNEGQYRRLIGMGGLDGYAKDNSDAAEAVLHLEQYIYSLFDGRNYDIDPYVAAGVPVAYLGAYSDYESDPCYEQAWFYEHDPDVFDSSSGYIENNLEETPAPIECFEKTGAYYTKLRVRDNPAGDNDALDEYRLWSDESEIQKVFVVHSKPIADFTVDLVADNEETCFANITDNCYDPDHASYPGRGVKEKIYKWKNANDDEWTLGRLPNRLPVGEEFFVSLIVLDYENEYSDAAVKLISTKEFRAANEEEDVEPPVIYIEPSAYFVNVGEQILIYAYAADDYGVDSFEMFINGVKVLDQGGRVFYTPRVNAPVTVTANALDINGNLSTKTVVLDVTGTRDFEPPHARIISPAMNASVKGKVNIIGTVTDNVNVKTYRLEYRLYGTDEYILFAGGNGGRTNALLGVFDTEFLEDGSYQILLYAEDLSGNMAYDEITYNVNNSGAQVTDTQGNTASGAAAVIVVNENIPGEPMVSLILSKQTLSPGEQATATVEAQNIEAESVEVYLNGSLAMNFFGILTFSGTPGILTLTANVTAADGVVYTDTAYCYVYGGENIPSIIEGLNIMLSHTAAVINEEVTLIVRDDGTDRYPIIKAFIDGEEKRLINGKLTFTSETAKTVTVKIIAADRLGNRHEAELECEFIDFTNTNVPLADLNIPDALSIDDIFVITEPITITGTAADEIGFKNYTLSFRKKGGDWRLISKGGEEVINGELGVFDPTLLMNGLYEIKLAAENSGGSRTEIIKEVFVDGNMKVGVTTLGFSDFNRKVGGISLPVDRVYDSRNKTSGDFGYGWTLSLADIKLYESHPLYDGYQNVVSGSLFGTVYTITETVPHFVVVDYGGGTVGRYKMNLSPNRQNYIPPGQTKVSFTEISSPASPGYTLNPGFDGWVNYMGETLFKYDGRMLDVNEYIVETDEGAKLVIDKRYGAVKLIGADGTEINISGNGYTGSDGTGYAFVRDLNDRITSITDPKGFTKLYSYDAAGNIESVTDEFGNVIFYEYDGEHNLTGMYSEDKTPIAYYEYDADRRERCNDSF